jgi:D-alanyl-D-alanine carboxypeptidase (penicillin-binding protein 5/6)
MGTASREARAAESQKLLNWGWQAWDAVRLFDAGKEVATVPVWKGRRPRPGWARQERLFVTVPKGEGDKLKTAIERTDPLVAPLAAGQRVGTHQGHHRRRHGGGHRAADVCWSRSSLAGLFGRAWDAIRLWIK